MNDHQIQKFEARDLFFNILSSLYIELVAGLGVDKKGPGLIGLKVNEFFISLIHYIMANFCINIYFF